MDLMHVTDWLPTLYSVAGGDIHKLRNVDGYDMWDTLSQASLCPREEILLNIDPVGGDSALRFRQWKLLVNISKYYCNVDFFDNNSLCISTEWNKIKLEEFELAVVSGRCHWVSDGDRKSVN